MARLSNLKTEDLTAEHKAALAQLQTVLSLDGLGGPFSVWPRMPGIGPKLIELFVTHRKEGKLEKRLFESMTLVVIRHWSAQFAWWAHSRRSKDLGIAPEIIDAIGHRKEPTIVKDDEKLVFDVTTEIMTRAAFERRHLCARQGGVGRGRADRADLRDRLLQYGWDHAVELRYPDARWDEAARLI